MPKFQIDQLKRELAKKELRHVTQLERADVTTDENARTAQMSFLSDAPIRHWFGYLTLDMTPASVDLTRFRAGAPLLVCHDRNQQVGIIENPRIENGKLRGDTRFSKSAFAGDIFQDVVDGIRKTTSSGFMVHELVLEKSTEDDDFYRATSWEPFEGSLEPIPADITVGVNRTLDEKVAEVRADGSPSDGETQNPSATADGTDKSLRAKADDEMRDDEEGDDEEVDDDEISDDPEDDEEDDSERAAPQTEVRTTMQTELEIKRAAEARILELGTTLEEVELARTFIAEDLTDEKEFKTRVLAKRKAAQPELPTADPAALAAQNGGVNVFDTRMNQLISSHRNGVKHFKGEGAAQRAYRFGMWFAGVVGGNARAMEFCKIHGLTRAVHTEKINEDGGFLVPPEFSNDIIDLREQYGVFRANARVEPMGKEIKNIRRRTTGLTAYPVGEGQRGTTSKKGWDMVELVARKWMVLAKLTNELNEDSVISLGDDLVREIAYAFSNAEDTAGFLGDGTSTYNGVVGLGPKFTGLSVTIANIAGVVVGSGNAYSELARADFLAMLGKLPQYAYAMSGGPKWYCSQSFWANVMVAITLAAGGVTAAEIEGARSKQFLGYPVVISQVLPAVEANSQICAYFGDLQLSSTLGDRREMQIALSDSNDVDFEEDQITIRGTTRFDIVNHDVGNASATAGLRVPGPIVALITAAS